MLILFIILVPHLAVAHGGGLDNNGGHKNHKTGEYHCHRDPCTPANRSSSYDRSEWGGWVDEDNDCQNTRAEILIRDSQVDTTLEGCRVVSGLWLLPYTGGSETSASRIDIDHVIPLKWAYSRGGSSWPRAKKRMFSNDPENLLSTSASANRSKGAKGPSRWMPNINKCAYAKKWQRLIEKYRLVINSAEAEVLTQACTGLRP